MSLFTMQVKLDQTRMKQIVIDQQLEHFQEAVHRARARTQKKVIAVLAPDVGAVVYPIRWTPSKSQNKPPNTQWGYYSAQKAKFFATNGFGKGIPTKRTNALNEGWLSISETIPGLGTSVVYWNTKHYTKYVVGGFSSIPPMQQFHRNTGWQPVLRKRDIIKDILIQGIIKEMKWIAPS